MLKKYFRSILFCVFMVVLAATLFACSSNGEYEPQEGGNVVSQVKLTVVNGVITDTLDTQGLYDLNARVSVTATIPKGKTFSYWTVGTETEPVSTSNPYVFNIQKTMMLTAHFENEQQKYNVTVENGVITGTSLTSASFVEGSSVSVSAEDPAQNKRFSGWTEVGSTDVVSTANPYVFTLNRDCNLIATYVDVITYSVSVIGGYIGTSDSTVSASFEPNTSVTVTAIIPDGKVFDGWKINNSVSPTITQNPYTFSIAANVSLIAVFSDEIIPVKYRIKVENGTISGHNPDAQGYYWFEENESVTAVADDRSEINEAFDYWRQDGEKVIGAGANYIFSVNADTTLKAIYAQSKLLEYTDCSVASVNGVSAIGVSTHYPLGSEIILQPTVDSGERFICWIDGITQAMLSQSEAFSLTLDRDRNIRAVVVPIPEDGYIGITVIGGKFYTTNLYTTPIDGDASYQTMADNVHNNVFLKADTKEGWNIALTMSFYNGTSFSTEAFKPTGSQRKMTAVCTGSVVFIPQYTSTRTVSVKDGNGYIGEDTSVSEKEVAYGDEVTVTPKTLTDKRFVEWRIGDSSVDETLLQEGGKYTFNVWENIVLTAVYESVCTITAVGGTIKNDGTSKEVAVGSLITVVAEETGDDRVFKGWFVGENRMSQLNEYTFRADGNVTVTAKFAPLYSLSVYGAKLIIGGVEVSSPHKVEDGTEFTVNAIIPDGKRFIKWTSDAAGNEMLSQSNPYSATVSANTSIFAVLTDEYVVSAINGTLSFGGNDVGSQGEYIAGDSVTVSAKTLSGKRFLHWLVNGEVLSTSNPYTFTVSESLQFEAKYVDVFSVTVYYSQGGGAEDVIVNQYASGEIATVTAISNEEKAFVNWTSDSEGNTIVSTSKSYNFTVTENVVLYAQYSIKYPVTVRIIDSYTGQPAADNYIVYRALGAIVNLKPTVPDRCRVKHWLTSDGNVIANTENTANYFVGSVTENMSFTMIVIRSCLVTVVGGKFSDNTTQKSIDRGGTAAVSATQRNTLCQNFDSWTINGNSVSTTLSYSFEVTSDTVITAKYGLIYSQKNVIGNAASESNIAKYSAYYSGGSQGFVFPGLSDEENIVIQGVDYCETLNWMFISGYVGMKSSDGETVPCYSGSPTGNLNSVIFILDMAQDGPNGCKGKFIKEIILSNVDGTDYKGHAGGIAVTSKNIFISNDSSLLRLSLSKITSTDDTTYRLAFDEQIKVPVAGAYCTFDYAEKVLWVGEFEYGTDYPTAANHKTNYNDVQYTAWTVGYILNENGGTGYNPDNGFKVSALNGVSGDGATPDYVLWHDNAANTNGTGSGGKVQGVAFAGNKIVVSRSWRRDGLTTNATQGMQELRIFDNEVYGSNAGLADGTVTINGVSVDCWYLDDATVIEAAPMSEDLATFYDKASGKYYVYVATESACYKYRNGDGSGDSAHPTDFAWKFEIVQ